MSEIERFEEQIGHHFNDPSWLMRALTHSSFGFENEEPYNERLEFLGDSVLGFVIAQELFLRFPDASEGAMSKMKSILVATPSLAAKARAMGLGNHLRLGKGERKSGGRKKRSILADGFEALIGAITMDGGVEPASRFILHLFDDDLNGVDAVLREHDDFKTILQERLQALGLGLPIYRVTKEEGPAHNRQYAVVIEVGDWLGPEGLGRSKKMAQQSAAKLLLEDSLAWQRFEQQAGQSKSQ